MGRPRRTRPHDFADTFARLGWDGTPEHYRTHSSRVARWVDEEGRDALRKRRKNYVMGNRLGRGVSSLKLAAAGV